METELTAEEARLQAWADRGQAVLATLVPVLGFVWALHLLGRTALPDRIRGLRTVGAGVDPLGR